MAIGEATLAWNYLQNNLVHLCVSLMEEGIGADTFPIWYAINNDRSLRQVLRSIYLLYLGEDKAGLDIKWLLDRCQDLEDDRNNAIHSPLWMTAFGEVLPISDFGHPRAARLATKKLLPEYRR